MNNQFLQHLKSITPQGKAEEKKMFIPADKFEPKKAEKIEMHHDEEQLDEATRSKYIKAYRKHKVGTDTGKLDIEDAKRNAAVLRRGGADDETIRQGSFSGKVPMSQYNKVNMAKYRFGNKAERSKEDGKKSPRNNATEMNMQLNTGEYIIDDPMHFPDHLKGFADRFLAPKTATMGVDKYTGNGFYPGS